MCDSRQGPFTRAAAEQPESVSGVYRYHRARSSNTSPTRKRGTQRIPRLRVGLVRGWHYHGIANGDFVRCLAFSVLCLVSITAIAPAQIEQGPREGPIILRAYGIPGDADAHIFDLIRLAILDEFKRRHPHIEPVSNQGLNFGHHNPKTQDVGTLMQIAGDIAPHVIPFGFRHTDTYIRSKFLYPLDKYIETMLGLDIEDGPCWIWMSTWRDSGRQLATTPKSDSACRINAGKSCVGSALTLAIAPTADSGAFSRARRTTTCGAFRNASRSQHCSIASPISMRPGCLTRHPKPWKSCLTMPSC